MTLDVRLRPETARDLSDAAVWYEKPPPGLGHQFLDGVVAAFPTIADAPVRFPIVHRNIRRVLIRCTALSCAQGA